MNTQKLLGRQKAFAERVAQGCSATEAYCLAGYKPRRRETAHRAASRLYRTPAVRAHISELRRTGDELAREETTLTIAQKLAFLTRLVLTSSASLREDDPLIQSHRILKDGTTSIRIPCKLKALKMHSELAGHFAPEPTPPPKTSDPIQDLLDQIRRKLPAPPPQNEPPKTPSHGTIPPPTANPNETHQPRHQTSQPTPQSHDTDPRCNRPALSGPEDNQPPSQKPTPPEDRNPLSNERSELRDKVPPATSTTQDTPPPRPAHQTSKTPPLPEQIPKPQQTTTKSPETPTPPKPLTPTDLRRLVLAQLRDSSPLHTTPPKPTPTPLANR